MKPPTLITSYPCGSLVTLSVTTVHDETQASLCERFCALSLDESNTSEGTQGGSREPHSDKSSPDTSCSVQNSKEPQTAELFHEGTYRRDVSIDMIVDIPLGEQLGHSTLRRTQNFRMTTTFGLDPHLCEHGEGCRIQEETFAEHTEYMLSAIQAGCPRNGELKHFSMSRPRRISDRAPAKEDFHGGQYRLPLLFVSIEPLDSMFKYSATVRKVIFDLGRHSCKTPGTCNELKSACEAARRVAESSYERGKPDSCIRSVIAPCWTMVESVPSSS